MVPNTFTLELRETGFNKNLPVLLWQNPQVLTTITRTLQAPNTLTYFQTKRMPNLSGQHSDLSLLILLRLPVFNRCAILKQLSSNKCDFKTAMISINILTFLRASEVLSHKCHRLVVVPSLFSAAVSIKHFRLLKVFKIFKNLTSVSASPFPIWIFWTGSSQ